MEGESWCIGTPALAGVCASHPDLHDLLMRSVLVRLHQQALASVCERFHPVKSRLARWLLMSQDRAQAPQFHVTQAFIASLLGVRRVSVTVAASDLQRTGCIGYHRGTVSVLDRERLMVQACPCYATDLRLMQGLHGAPARSAARAVLPGKADGQND
jgi:CRP-like cAMP-binding protein